MEDSNLEEDNGDNLQSSELGTKEYWNAIYRRDKHNYENHGDVGEIWFGEDSELRILRWLQMNVDVKKRIIDLGCGNGMMLVELAREGYEELTGTDYSVEAIDLCKTIMKSQSFDEINFKVVDLTEDCHNMSDFNVALDKGTYDAISLNPDNAAAKKKQYIKNVSHMLNADGLFLITSCNWTEEELIKQFESGNLVTVAQTSNSGSFSKFYPYQIYPLSNNSYTIL